MTTGIFIGRFQPFHNAHLEIVKDILKDNDRIIIGIGSAQHSNEEKNPFTSKERKEMIESALQQELIHYYEIVEIPDVNDNEKWVDHVISIAGEFDIDYTINPLVKELMEAKGKKVVWTREIEGVSATEVRKRMREGGDWKSLVPKVVAKEIEKIGIGRVK